MKILISGMNGTFAPRIAAELLRLGHQVVAWNRAIYPIDTRDLVSSVFTELRPDAVFHVATGSLDWAEWIALECAERSIDMLHTSSVSVYGAHQFGPLTHDIDPEPDDEYGRYKREAELRIFAANPDVASFRIGWQIGDAPGSNNMIDYFHRAHEDHGVVRVSTRWIPASSMLDDTAECLCRHFFAGDRGLFHVDANPGLSLYDLALAAKARLRTSWIIEPTDSPIRDNRMIDPRISIRSL